MHHHSQQHIPHAALAPAGKGVADLFPGRAVLGQRALPTVSGLAACGLHVKDGVDQVPGDSYTGTSSLVHFSKVFGHHLPLHVGHIVWEHGGILLLILSLRTGSKLPMRQKTFRVRESETGIFSKLPMQ